jgi:hypothetical protein
LGRRDGHWLRLAAGLLNDCRLLLTGFRLFEGP